MKTIYLQYKKIFLSVIFGILSLFTYSQTTFYSFQSGNWGTANTWTTDPSGTTLVGSVVPANNDNVVILNARAVSLAANVATTGHQITINAGGILNLSTYSITTLTSLNGDGLLRINRNYFPTVTTNNFVLANGGTVEYYDYGGAGTDLPNQLTYNNLHITNSLVGTQILRFPKPNSPSPTNYTINGNLKIFKTPAAGTLTVSLGNANDNVLINMTIFKNLTDSTGCAFNVYSGGNVGAHNLYVYGNLRDDGTLDFQTAADYYSETNGAANIEFLGNSDKTVIINSTTSFYGFTINKGSDQTYILDVTGTSSGCAPFDGSVAGQDNGATTYGVISLKKGTLKLGTNITVPQLVAREPTNPFTLSTPFCISTECDYNAGLWIDGATVTHGGYFTGLYGKLRISAGSFTIAPVTGQQSSIATRIAGEILIEGGTLSCMSIRTSTVSATNPRGSYTQTGGTVTLTGPQRNGAETSNGGYPLLSLSFPEMSFIMSGGTLNVKRSAETANTGNEGGIFIACSSYNVTGGNVIVEAPPNTYNFNINSTAPFYNLTMKRQTGGTGEIRIEPQTVNITGVSSSVSAHPLVVLNDLIIDGGGTGFNAAVFNALGTNPTPNNVTVGGNFIVNSGTSYITGNNTTIFNGFGNQTFTNAGSITTDGTTAGIYNLITTNTSKTAISNDLTINYDLTINANTELNDNNHTITVLRNITNSGTHKSGGAGNGLILMTGANNRNVYGDGNGLFGNLTINKGAGTANTVTLSSDQKLSGKLVLTNGILHIGIYNLELFRRNADVITRTNGLIRTAGYQSDGGLTLNLDNSFKSNVLFPVGTGTIYTPATITINGTLTQQGKISIKPVPSTHPLRLNGGQALAYYWRTISSGFQSSEITNITHSYDYGSTFSGSYNNAWNYDFISTWTNTNGSISGNRYIVFTNHFNLDGDYTAGNSGAFSNLVIYYSRQNGNWNDVNTWSLTGHNDTDPPGKWPGEDNTVQNCFIIIGDGNIYNHTITIPVDDITVGSMQLNEGSILNIQTTTGHNFGTLPSGQIVGTGKIMISSAASTIQFPGGDFGDFIGPFGGTVEYYTTGSQDFTIPSSSSSGIALNTYKNLIISPGSSRTITMPDQDMTIYGTLTVDGSSGRASLNSTTTRSLNINSNLIINHSTLQFRNTTVQNVAVLGDMTIANTDAAFEVYSANTVVANNLTISGSLSNSGRFDMNNNTRYCNVTFIGNNDEDISGSGTITDFYKLSVNKDNSQTPILNVTTTNFSISGASNPALELLNGTFRLSTAQTLNIAQTSSYNIPQTACLSVNQAGATINIASGADDTYDLNLSGKLEIQSGTVNIGTSTNNNNNDIVYSSSGSPEINVQNGTLFVNGQIRRVTTSTLGSLIYNQSNGTVTINGRNVTTGVSGTEIRAKLEILNEGSIFNLTGGSIIIVRAGGTTFGDLYIRPELSTVNGGTIYLQPGNITSQTYKIDASVPLNNLTINGYSSTQTSTANMMVYPLDLKGTLTINANSSLISNNIDVLIGGDFINSGTYTAGSNTTTFNGSGAQGANISSATNFNNLTINKSAGILTFSGAEQAQILNNLNILSGTLNDGGKIINVTGNIYNLATHSSSGSGCLNLNKSGSAQEIDGDGTGLFGNITINNSSGVNLFANTEISQNLQFTSGILYIDDKQLTFGESATVSTSSGAFSNTRMIKLNGALSDAGVKKRFPNTSYNFNFPIGVSGKYTPVRYNITSNSADGSITVTPVNTKHPCLTEATSNQLNYYWSTSSSGFSGISVTHTYNYIAGDVSSVESQYVSGRFYNQQWTPQSGISGTINTTDHTMTLTTVNYLDGEYTAGHLNNFQLIKKYYSRNATTGGSWTNPLTWSVTGHAGSSDGSYPQGQPATIAAGHTVSINADNQSAYSLSLSGTLNLQSTIIHNFGHVSGAGKLMIKNTGGGSFVFPGGNYDDFMNTTNALVEFDGTGTLPSVESYQDLSFINAGDKSFASNDITVKGNLNINDGRLVINSTYNNHITVYKNWTDGNTNRFVPQNGTTSFAGTLAQSINNEETFYNLEINNPSEVNFPSNLNINGTLSILQGNFRNSTTTLRTLYVKGDWLNSTNNGFNEDYTTVTFDGTTTQTLTAGYGESFNNLTINNSSGVNFENSTKTTNQLTLTSGVLFIGSNLFTFSQSALSPAGTFNSSNMIATNGLTSDAGCQKYFAAGASAFTFPIGIKSGLTQKYNPAIYNFNSNTKITSIKVKFINTKHPVLSESSPNELSCYWIVDADSLGSGSYSVFHNYGYNDADISATEGSYVAARFFDNAWTIDGIPNSMDIANNAIKIKFVGSTPTYVNIIKGEYTAGYALNFQRTDIYYSNPNATGILGVGADWNSRFTWTNNQSDYNQYPSGPPSGNPVILQANHKVLLRTDNGSAYSINLGSNSQINLYTTRNHNFGYISGTGTINLYNRPDNRFYLPDGDYTNFVTNTGGTIELEGSGLLPSNRIIYNNLTLLRNGTKDLPNFDITLNGSLTINEGQLNNTNYNRNINIKGNWINNVVSNGFLASNGTVIFSGNTTLVLAGDEETFYNVTVENGGSFTVPALKGTIINGAIVNNGTFTVGSNATGTGWLLDNGTTSGSGNFNIQRYIWASRYQLVSSPVPDATVSVYSSLWSLRRFIEENSNNAFLMNAGYQYMGSSDPLIRGEGYVIRLGSDQVINYISNRINTGDNITFPVTKRSSSVYSGENHVGNPYPSGLKVKEFLQANDDPTTGSIQNYIAVWDKPASGHDFTTDGWVQVTESGYATGIWGGKVNGILQTGQAFYVFARRDANVVFNNNMRTINNDSRFFKSASIDNPLIQIALTNSSNQSNDILLVFSEDATDGFDIAYDANKFENQNFYLYSKMKNEKFAIQGLAPLKPADKKIIPLGLYISTESTYKLNAFQLKNFETNTSIYLEDMLLDSVIDINLNPIYEFKSPAGNISDRFRIIFVANKNKEIVTKELENVTNQTNNTITISENTDSKTNVNTINNPNSQEKLKTGTNIGNHETSFKVYSFDKNIVIKAGNQIFNNTRLLIYNMLGEKLLDKNLNSNFTIIQTNYTTGYYIAKVVTDEKIISKKLFIK